MMIIKAIFKFVLALIVFVILAAATFAALNWTLIRNLPGAQEGASDAYYTERQQPRQIVQGANVTDELAAPHETEQFSAALENWENTGGKALLVWHDGTLVLEQYAQGITPEMRSKSFSLHKSVLGLVAAIMEADGLIDLDDPLSLYIEAYKDDPRGALTIRDMLTHQSGLERYSMFPPTLKGLNLLLSDKIERTALKAKIVDDNPVFDYSNLGYQIAGAALRNAISMKTSKSYAEYLSERLWQKIGADDAYLWAEKEDGAPRFYSGLLAAPKDWLKLGIAIADNNESVIPKDAMSAFLAPSALNPNYGLGIWRGMPEDLSREYGPSTALSVISKAPFTLSDMVYMDGFGGQRVYVSQSEKLVIVRVGDVLFDWDDTALPNLITQALDIKPAKVKPSSITLKGENDRAINLRILAPTTPVQNPRLMIFSHGAFSANTRYDALLKPLAESGIHIAIPLHVDSEVHPNTKDYKPADWTSLRLEDIKVTAEYFADKPIGQNSWISAGHSFGAKIAHIYGGASLEPRPTITTALGRPNLVVSLSPPGDGVGGLTTEEAAKIDVPTLLVTGDEDIVPGMISNWKDHLMAHHNAPNDLSTAAIFKGQNHYFNALYGRPTDRPLTKSDTDLIELITAFTQDDDLPQAESYSLLK